MGESVLGRTLRLVFPIIFFGFLTIFLFKPYFLKGLIPVPGDILIGHYYPWKDQVWDGRIAGYPIKNFILFDGVRQTLPWRLLAIEQIKKGQFPFWNPYNLLGTPLLGNLQAAALYPLNFLLFIFPILDGWTIYIFLQPFLGGLFGYFFGQSLKLSKRASLLTGVAWGFSLIMMNHLEFGIDGHTVLWLPLALGAVNRFLETNAKRWGGLLALAVLMTLLGGYPPPAIYNMIILLGYVVLKTRPFFSKKLLGLIFWIIVAFGLSSPQILPSLELSTKTVRGQTQFGVLSNEPYFYPWENLSMIVAPDIFGHPSTNNFFSRIYYSDNPSVGIVALIFVLYSVLRIKKFETKYWWFWTIVPMLFMIKTPLGEALRNVKISFFSLVTPMRMIWVVSFSLSVLAGIGFDWFLLTVIKKRERKFLLTIYPIVIIYECLFCVTFYILLVSEGPHQLISLRNLLLPFLFLSAGSALILSILFFPRTAGLCSFLVIVFSAGELLRQGIKYNPFIKKNLVYPAVEIFADLKEERALARIVVTHPELIPVNANIPYKLRMLDSYASIYDSRAGELIRLANEKFPLREIEGYPRIVFQTRYQSPLIDLFGVKYVFSLDDIRSKQFVLVSQIGKTKLYRNNNAFPPAFLATAYDVEKGDLAVANRLLTIDKEKEVVLEKEPKLKIGIGTPSDEQRVVVKNYQENTLELETYSSKNSLLVLTESYDPGWEATIDGVKTEVLRADYNFRSVALPSGSHQVIFQYRPRSFFLGLKLFVIFVFLIFVEILKSFLLKLPLLKNRYS